MQVNICTHASKDFFLRSRASFCLEMIKINVKICKNAKCNVNKCCNIACVC